MTPHKQAKLIGFLRAELAKAQRTADKNIEQAGIAGKQGKALVSFAHSEVAHCSLNTVFVLQEALVNIIGVPIKSPIADHRDTDALLQILRK